MDFWEEVLSKSFHKASLKKIGILHFFSNVTHTLVSDTFTFYICQSFIWSLLLFHNLYNKMFANLTLHSVCFLKWSNTSLAMANFPKVNEFIILPSRQKLLFLSCFAIQLTGLSAVALELEMFSPTCWNYSIFNLNFHGCCFPLCTFASVNSISETSFLPVHFFKEKAIFHF